MLKALYNTFWGTLPDCLFKLIVIRDYESAFDGVTLIQIPYMIPLAGFQPLSVAKTNTFSLTTGVLQKDISVRKSMP